MSPTMNATDLLSTRASNGKLGQPAPSAEELNAIVHDALRAPDHGAVRPWKILLVRGDARAKLGDVFVEAQRRCAPDTPDDKLERLRGKPLRAPVIAVVAATVREHPKAPEIEQVLSAGTVVHGMLLGLQARGYAGMWRTGPMAYNDDVKKALGLATTDHVVAYLYMGTPTREAPVMPRPAPEGFVEEWIG